MRGVNVQEELPRESYLDEIHPRAIIASLMVLKSATKNCMPLKNSEATTQAPNGSLSDLSPQMRSLSVTVPRSSMADSTMANILSIKTDA